MNFVEYTKNLINKYTSDTINCRTLIVGAGFKAIDIDPIRIIEKNEDGMDLNDWIIKRRNESSDLFDTVILSRVLEHFPIRQLDWYLYNIYTVMRENAKLICIVPDMPACANELEKEFDVQKDGIIPTNMFRVNRLTYELLSEGDHVWDRHASWTSANSVKYYLEMENLFKVEAIERIKIDSTIVPLELEFIARRV